MDYVNVAAVLSAAIPTLSYGPFLNGIFKGSIKPHRISWLIWSIVYTVLVAEQFSAGAKGAIWLTLSITLISYLVSFLSIKKGIGSFNRRSIGIIGLVIGLLVLVVNIENPTTSILLLISINATAMIFTLVKTYKQPWSETISFWAAHLFGSLFSVLALGEGAGAAALAYPIYGVIATTVAVLLMLTKRNSSTIKRVLRFETN